ncbi:hypothetical protein BGZ72_006212 [Mortierella alpina]|nr:hypothetical protein BGZ72_006212 [Mortierella alpina]
MSTSSTPRLQTAQGDESSVSYQCLLEHAQSKLAHFQELLGQQEQRQLDTELAYKQRIDELRRDLRTTKQELLEDCAQGHAARAATHASSTFALKQQRQHLQDENNHLKASLQSAEAELTRVTLKVETLENRTRRMGQELHMNELLKAELQDRHLADTILASQVNRLMDVEQGVMQQCIQVLNSDDSDDSDDTGSDQPCQTLLDELQNACSGPVAPVLPSSGMPETAEISQGDVHESGLQMAFLCSVNDSCGQSVSSDPTHSVDGPSSFSFTPPAKLLTPTTGNADQLVRVLGHYLHQHYQHALGGRQEQLYNPFSWFIKTSAIVTISWAAMTMQMLSAVESLIGDVEGTMQVPT